MTRRLMSRWLLPAAALALTASPHAGESASFPSGFRGWATVKSALITEANPAFQTEGGIHHIYANLKAVEGYRTGEFPDGAVIVYELVATKEQGGIISETDRRRVDIMSKDESHNPQTGGWRFDRFMGSDESKDVIGDAGGKCFACHAKAATHADVFSQVR